MAQLHAAVASCGGHTAFDVSEFEDPNIVRARQVARVSELFDLCQPTLVLRVVLFVQVGVAVAGLAASNSAPHWIAQMAMLAFPALARHAVVAGRCVCRQAGAARIAPWQRAAAAVLIGGATAVAGWSLLLPLGMANGGTWPLFTTVLAGMAFASLVRVWLDQRARSARPADASARLAELQSRIRPHFLFNALNTAVALVRIDPERAESVLEDLSQLFRVALAEVGASVTLAEEIDLAQRYLAIEQVRFGDRLAISWERRPRGFAGAACRRWCCSRWWRTRCATASKRRCGGGTVRVRVKARHWQRPGGDQQQLARHAVVAGRRHRAGQCARTLEPAARLRRVAGDLELRRAVPRPGDRADMTVATA